jgi:hypothetical protein
MEPATVSEISITEVTATSCNCCLKTQLTDDIKAMLLTGTLPQNSPIRGHEKEMSAMKLIHGLQLSRLQHTGLTASAADILNWIITHGPEILTVAEAIAKLING